MPPGAIRQLLTEHGVEPSDIHAEDAGEGQVKLSGKRIADETGQHSVVLSDDEAMDTVKKLLPRK